MADSVRGSLMDGKYLAVSHSQAPDAIMDCAKIVPCSMKPFCIELFGAKRIEYCPLLRASPEGPPHYVFIRNGSEDFKVATFLARLERDFAPTCPRISPVECRPGSARTWTPGCVWGRKSHSSEIHWNSAFLINM